MLERIRNCGALRATHFLLLGLGICTLSSCATHEEPQLVSSGAERESALPWNKQEKWEGTGQFGGLTEGMAGGRR
jgi:hypothetical protein